jgi:hypothetical protein
MPVSRGKGKLHTVSFTVEGLGHEFGSWSVEELLEKVGVRVVRRRARFSELSQSWDLGKRQECYIVQTGAAGDGNCEEKPKRKRTIISKSERISQVV